MIELPDAKDRLIDAALGLTVTKGWGRLSMAEIAREADVPLSDAYQAFPTKAGIVDGLISRIDRAMLAGPAPDPQEPVRDRLFDIIMRRFDALQPHKNEIRALRADLAADPYEMLRLIPAWTSSLRWMLEAAGLSATGPRGLVRLNGLALIFASAFNTWLDDDSEDMARTMAAVDRGLRRAETAIRSLPGSCLPCHSRRRDEGSAEREEPLPSSPSSPGEASPPPPPGWGEPAAGL